MSTEIKVYPDVIKDASNGQWRALIREQGTARQLWMSMSARVKREDAFALAERAIRLNAHKSLKQDGELGLLRDPEIIPYAAGSLLLDTVYTRGGKYDAVLIHPNPRTVVWRSTDPYTEREHALAAAYEKRAELIREQSGTAWGISTGKLETISGFPERKIMALKTNTHTTVVVEEWTIEPAELVAALRGRLPDCAEERFDVDVIKVDGKTSLIKVKATSTGYPA